MTLLQFLTQNNGKPVDMTWLEVANKFNVKIGQPNKKRSTYTNDIWRSHLKRQRRKNEEVVNTNVEELVEASTEEMLGSYNHNLELGEITVNTYYLNPPRPEQVIKDHKINTDEYVLCNYYSKAKSKGWLVTAQFKLKNKEAKFESNFMNFLKTFESKKQYVNVHKEVKGPRADKNLLEITIPDLHIDKRGLEGESFDELGQKYFNLIFDLVNKAAKSCNIDKIAFIVGNDFFNTDNIHNATASSLNVQEINEYWDTAYEKGFNLLVNVIEKLMTYSSNINVIGVPGNHGKSKEFYLTHALKAYFRNCPTIEFSVSSKPRKVLVYGNTCIMYHHGNCKLESLPGIMSQEFSEDWGKTLYKRIHVGDKHHFMEKELNGVIIKQFPSLSQTDTWHNEKGFILNQRKGLVLVHNYVEGLVATFEGFMKGAS